MPKKDTRNKDDEEKRTQAQDLLDLTSDMHFFHNEHNECFARLQAGNHYEVWNIESEQIQLILTSRYMNAYNGRIPSDKSINQAIRVLKVKSRLEGKKEDVHIRVAETDEAIYLDLCNEEWEAIEIKKEGWKVISNPPVHFIRTSRMKSLPKPKRNGSIEELRPFINASNDVDFHLIIAWLLSTLKGNMPYPVLILQGEQGSAKSTTTKVLKSLTDPADLALRTLPNDETALAILAKNTWILGFDNLSGLSNSMSDALCKLSTGGGISLRRLFTTMEESVIKNIRPLILNGIDDIGRRPDLLDRSIVLMLPSISGVVRVDEKEFWNNFESKHPRILGALCTIASSALNELPTINLKVKPRMADFATWVTAAEKALNWDEGYFMDIYEENRNKAIDQGLELDSIAVAVYSLMKDRDNWEATTTETLNQLRIHADEEIIKSGNWPTANKLKDRLRRIAPLLRSRGIDYIDLPRSSRGGRLQLRRNDKPK